MTTPETPPPLVPAAAAALTYFTPSTGLLEAWKAGRWLMVWAVAGSWTAGMLLLHSLRLMFLLVSEPWYSSIKDILLSDVSILLAIECAIASLLGLGTWQCFACRSGMLRGHARFARRAELFTWMALVLVNAVGLLLITICCLMAIQGSELWALAWTSIILLSALDIALGFCLRAYQRAAVALGAAPLRPAHVAARWLLCWLPLNILASGGVPWFVWEFRGKPIGQLRESVLGAVVTLWILAAAAGGGAWLLRRERVAVRPVFWAVLVIGSLGWVPLLVNFYAVWAPHMVYFRWDEITIQVIVQLCLGTVFFAWTLFALWRAAQNERRLAR